MSACSGESSTPVQVDPGQPDTGVLFGVLSIQEHAGKRVIDAWFTDNDVARLPVAADWLHELDSCNLVYQQGESAAGKLWERAAADAPLDWRHTRSVGDKLFLSSRGGNYATLQIQQHGSLIVYSTPQRWFSIPIPTDTTLEIPGSEQFHSLTQLGIQPLQPLIMLSPADAILANPGDAITWQPSAHPGDRVTLLVSVIGDNDTELADGTLHCTLEDDGSFTLPIALQTKLEKSVHSIAVFLSRERRTMHVAGDSGLRVIQSSYSQPDAP
ncbi:MAG: hypothetical protein V3U76_15700 [Granulosicoccus sp.]